MFVLMDEIWRILKPSAQLAVVTYYGVFVFPKKPHSASSPKNLLEHVR